MSVCVYYVCVYVCTCVCMCAYVYVCMYSHKSVLEVVCVCMCVCVCVCVCLEREIMCVKVSKGYSRSSQTNFVINRTIIHLLFNGLTFFHIISFSF